MKTLQLLQCRRLFLALVVLFHACATRGEYAIRNGDTVVILGDSITAAREYSKIIENYTLLRFPERKVRFINAGRGGETARQSLARLDKDVFGAGATVLTVAYGINDIGWGVKADAAHRKEYLDAIGEIVDRCKAHGVRVFICSAAITAEDPDKAEQGFLKKMCDDGLALARSKGAGTIDVQTAMREVQGKVLAAGVSEPDKTKQPRMHAPDGVHLNDLGQMAMAFAILKGLGAPANVSSATIDAQAAKVVTADDCQITKLRKLDQGVAFTRLDERLPLNLAPLWLLSGFYIPIQDELNRYLLTVTNLPQGEYALIASGKEVGSWSAERLGAGLNISSVTTNGWEPGGLWDAQGHTLKVLTDMRDAMANTRRGMDATLKAHPRLESLEGKAKVLEKSIVELQREMARPVPMTFEIRKRGV
jgi:lysophospholipase L1-like esterase